MARTPLARRLEDVCSPRGQQAERPDVAGHIAGSGTPPTIAIVGAGLAGLTAAHSLKASHLGADVFEASGRLGGRCWTLRGAFAEGQIAEHGGELIDSDHTAVKRLAGKLGLKLDDLVAAEPEGTETMGWFDGAVYTVDQMTTDFGAIREQLQADYEAGKNVRYGQPPGRGRDLDEMSVSDWIREYVPSPRFAALLEVAYTIELGAECDEQSALNLITILGSRQTKGGFSIFGESDERFHIHDGNDQLVDLLADDIGRDTIQLETDLLAIAQNGTGFDLELSNGGSTVTRTFDIVVLALPFSMLRSVDYSRAGFEPLKVQAIQTLGMGSNSKLHVQFSSRPWYGDGCNAETLTDLGYQNTWEVTRAQDGAAGILVNFTGGTAADAFGTGAPEAHARAFLGQIDRLLNGLSDAWNGLASVDCWRDDQWTRGSYAYWKVGQWSSIRGIEPCPQGTCHFAGEHTSLEYQGYLNGAVESGQRVAKEILADLS